MRVVALVSGGKDSCYNMIQCVAAGHEIVALANLQPEIKDELDSFMYQTVGHHGIELYAEAMDLPLYRQVIKGTSVQQGKDYTPTPEDEVEDLYELLKKVKNSANVDAVSVGAILSDYQRVRVENVCVRLGLVPLAYLWRRDQTELLQEMIACNVNAIVIKVAALGLDPSLHLGQSLDYMQAHLLSMKEKYGLNVCGEGGEYETFTLDCPLFKKAVVIDELETVVHSNDAFAPVGYLSFKSMHLVNKDDPDLSQLERLNGLLVKSPLDYLNDLNSDDDLEELEGEETEEAVNGEVPNIILEEPKVLRETDPVSVGPTMQMDSKGFCWLGNIVGKGCDPVRATSQAMTLLKDILFQNGYSMSNVSAISLYVSDLKNYAVINAEYAKFFNQNPPIRVCVEAPLPENIPVFLEALAYRKCSESSDGKQNLSQHMHVQGISHWAPANIGPYSQVIRVDELLYLAGQIGLVPGTLQMVEGGMKMECKLALRHMGRIVRAMDPKTHLRDVVQGICYVTHHSHIAEARKEWEKRTNNAIVDYIVVPQLPRGALVEWHIWAHIYNSRFEYEETGCYVKEKIKVTLQRRWNYENNVAAIVCRATVGSDEEVIDEDSLVEIVRYALRKLLKDTESNVTSFLRVFYKVGRLSPRQLEAVLQEVGEFKFAYSVIPSCGLLHERTLLSICGVRHE